MEAPPSGQGYRFFEWVNRRIGWISSVVIVVAIGLGIIGPIVANEESATFSPTGDIYDIEQRVLDIFEPESATITALYIVEAQQPEGQGSRPGEQGSQVDVLTQAALLEFKTRSDAVRGDTRDVLGRALNSRLASGSAPALGLVIDGIFSLADLVDSALPGGLATASDGDVKKVLADLFDEAPGMRSLLATQATTSLDTFGGEEIAVWRAPAFRALVSVDADSFSQENEDQESLDTEAWLIEVRTDLRGGQAAESQDDAINVWGVGIDFSTEFADSFEAGIPFIFLAVALIVLLVGALLRSYWAAMVVGVGLGATMLTYNGIVGIIQLDVSPLLQLIVPIAMISFGVDFFIHGAGRVREAQVEGASRQRAYPIGATAVFTALLLAVITSASAFLSNAASGIEAITDFGVGAAVALIISYLFLGLLGPKALLSLEEGLGARPTYAGMTATVPFRIAFYKVLFVLAALVAGVVVSGAVAFPPQGTVFAVIAGALLLIFLLLFVYVPFRWTKRRNRRAADRGREMTDSIKGAGQGFRAAGTVVHFLARWRAITLPVVAVIAVIGVVSAFQVSQEFEFVDFLPSDSDAVVGFEKAEEYFIGEAGGPGYVFVEGDLTQPETLRAMDEAVAGIQASSAPFRRNLDGVVEVDPNAVSIARTAVASPPAAAAVAAATGVSVTDTDGDGLPDSADQVRAVYETAVAAGLPEADGRLILRPDLVQRVLFVDGEDQATRLEIQIESFTDEEIVAESWDALQVVSDDLAADLGSGFRVGVSGPPITNKDTLDSFVEAMLISLPIAIVLATLIAALVMRSFLYALASIVPILLVVAWVYGFMFLTDFSINPVTATIAAIAIGVGIDFATHFTVRFREEFAGEPSRFPALRRAGEGTGGALALSALTSVIGFWALSLAPTPIFATFGTLTAVMIIFSLAVSLLVLPSLLLLVTPSRKGEERAKLESDITGGEYTYDPHDRATSHKRAGFDKEKSGD